VARDYLGDHDMITLGSAAKREAASDESLVFRDLTLGYDRHPAVHHLSGTVVRGDLLALVGPNGAGKSTLLKGIMGYLTPLDGAIERVGVTPRSFAYLPQQSEIDRSFPLRVFDLVAMGFWCDIGLWWSVGSRRERQVLQALNATGLSGFEDRLIGSLSGGQFQRVLFARLLLQDAAVILLDEPFTSIDTRTVAELIALIKRWHSEGRTIIAATHDLEQVREHFPRTLLLAREPVAWGATTPVLTTENLLRARRLCEAWDEDAEVCRHGAHEAQKVAS